MAYPLINGAAINASAAAEAGGGYTAKGFLSTEYGQPTLVLMGDLILLVPSVATLPKFGTPALAARHGLLGVESMGAVSRLGALVVETGTNLQVKSVTETLRFGAPVMTLDSIISPLFSVGVVSLAEITQFGAAELTAHLDVFALEVAPTVMFGHPAVGNGFFVSGFSAASFGVPRLETTALHQSLTGTRFGMHAVQGVVHAAPLPGLRYGVPRVVGASPAVIRGFMSTEFGVHHLHWSARPMPIAPSTRYGRPTIMRSSKC